MSKPVIEIHYDRDEPHVIIPKELEGLVEVKMIDEFEVATKLIEYKGVSVYQAIKDDYGSSCQLSDCWAGTYCGVNIDDDDCFDLRDLPGIPEELAEDYQKRFPTSDPNDRPLPELAYAIDRGWLTQDGFTEPEDEDVVG